ncbi:MAG: tRNA pseudouridine(54/55) synthase Pus10 [Candidatus Odinarchaeum yellowstonii]|uniref:tRNA pseudouridine synthase Pus10 n=1 Tax=Odinarchaeota yellowstonii (strain LCB_4) TaxID=1841599 RepID=A0AAF0D0S9_ODILC|nr:MAG: tRNA pseudouridine(54/55) synthase Pus10 [Candidatus Odinarchaeum yellowstonii]
MNLNILEKAVKILREYKLCTNCLGRMFGMLGTGLTNMERGESIVVTLMMLADEAAKNKGGLESNQVIEALQNVVDFKPLDKFLSERACLKQGENICYICENIFSRLEESIKNSLNEISSYEFKTFLVGTNIGEKIIEREDNFRAKYSLTWGESIKSELNREIGKIIKHYFPEVETNFENPHIVIEYSIPDFNYKINVTPVFIYGRYRKLVRGIPQTKWICKSCKGAGCERCGFKGKMYEISVEELISKPVIDKLKGVNAKFHGAGREDIDAIMSGFGRPFVLEVKGAKKRFVELKHLETEINEYANGKVEVSDLNWSSRSIIRKIKALSKITRKKYKAIVQLTSSVPDEKLIEAEKYFSNMLIQQRTPKRVAHRRSDKLREKQVYSLNIRRISDDRLEVIVDCQGGLYVKELISGDDGRTKPSLSEILGAEAKCIQLDVLEVDFPNNELKTEIF